jgi:hypothetical protein
MVIKYDASSSLLIIGGWCRRCGDRRCGDRDQSQKSEEVVMNGKRSRRNKLQQIRRGSTKYKHIQIGKPLLIFVVLNNE